jgi:hypothetical protein
VPLLGNITIAVISSYGGLDGDALSGLNHGYNFVADVAEYLPVYAVDPPANPANTALVARVRAKALHFWILQIKEAIADARQDLLERRPPCGVRAAHVLEAGFQNGMRCAPSSLGDKPPPRIERTSS